MSGKVPPIMPNLPFGDQLEGSPDCGGGLMHQAKTLIDSLPAHGLTWERLAYHFSVRADIEAGLADCAAGRVHTNAQARKMFGLE